MGESCKGVATFWGKCGHKALLTLHFHLSLSIPSASAGALTLGRHPRDRLLVLQVERMCFVDRVRTQQLDDACCADHHEAEVSDLVHRLFPPQLDGASFVETLTDAPARGRLLTSQLDGASFA